jgi:hypothetical protein
MNPKADFKARGGNFRRAAKGQEGYGRFRLRNAPGDQAGTGAYTLGRYQEGIGENIRTKLPGQNCLENRV